ncbi:MAG TPA: hypothetical protein VLA24_17820 [Pseudomonadales bacterium]|nr:hypothetical protein [Pseudomonadales bacterium]
MTTVLVTFDMWGRRCTTRFESVAEAIAWISICYDKGFMKPIALQGGTANGDIYYDEHQLLEMVEEK